MGASFTNVQVRSPEGREQPTRDAIVSELAAQASKQGFVACEEAAAAERTVLVGPPGRWIGVYDEATESQDTALLDALAKALSKACRESRPRYPGPRQRPHDPQAVRAREADRQRRARKEDQGERRSLGRRRGRGPGGRPTEGAERRRPVRRGDPARGSGGAWHPGGEGVQRPRTSWKPAPSHSPTGRSRFDTVARRCRLTSSPLRDPRRSSSRCPPTGARGSRSAARCTLTCGSTTKGARLAA